MTDNLNVSGVSYVLAPPSPRYDWTPQPDTTAYELALLMPALVRGDIKSVPESCMRHLTIREPKP